LADVPRLVVLPQRKNFGRFRELINAINLSETQE
jgi:hypothetical protein